MNASERDLFRLDSILAAVGVQGEEQILKVMRKYQSQPAKAKLGILKVILETAENGSDCLNFF